ncbi:MULTISPECIES: MFS transporter [unclassified Streptomyces]|uniref:MFS transporter n=1 Tax=unclassified Streptomyces TaxID=2593676 RepID=UPI002DDB868A|nr:MFS transporter [Streptomyces sp. NBC_01766]WSC21457.1 MFS transporter [Streptomyces sp. NBC_01766]
MYIASSRSTPTPGSTDSTDSADGTEPAVAGETATETPATPGKRAAVAPNVLALGSVSLITDISSEMITAVLPMYVIFTLGLSPLQFGALNGMYFGVTALVRLAGGHAADRWQRRKLVAGSGYALSALCKLGLFAAGSSVPVLGAVIAADRTGKGLRTGPRDALISLSSTPETLGRSFGIHRALDTTGAFLGPLVAFGLLLANPDRYDTVFVASFCIAAFAVVILALTVRDRRRPMDTPHGASARAALRLLLLPRFRRVCIGAALLGTVALSDSFVYLLLQQRLDISVEYFPLLPLGTTATYLLLAVPFGQLADRLGRLRVFIGGYVVLLGAYLLLFGPFGGAGLLVVTLILHGLFYAATDGVLMAAVGPMLPAQLRASGMALIQTGQSVAMLGSSVLFGAAWTLWGLHTALALALVALVTAILAALWILPLREESSEA